MYSQETVETKASGLILILGNPLLNTRDMALTIGQRIRILKASHIVVV